MRSRGWWLGLLASAVVSSGCNDAWYRVGSGALGEAGSGGEQPTPTVNCTPVDDSAIAQWDFEDGSDLGADAAGLHHGAVRDSVHAVVGPEGCGQAVQIDAAAPGLIEVPTAAEFQLTEGSLELWARVPQAELIAPSLVSRDAYLTNQTGHFLLRTAYDGRLFVRIQRAAGEEAFACSDAPPVAGQWFHIGINFGPPSLELFLNGQLMSGSGTVQAEFLDASCGLNVDAGYGIDGNDNPLVLGSGTSFAQDGSPDPADSPFAGGELDHVVLRSARRDFTAPPL